MQLRRIVLSIAGLAVCLGAGGPATAQDDPGLVGAYVVQVKPDGIDQYEDLIGDVFQPAQQKAGVAWTGSWVGLFGDNFTYYNFFPLENFAELDQPPDYMIELGEPAADLAVQQWLKCVNGRQAVVLRPRPDLSIPPTQPPKYAVAIRVTVHLGKDADFASWLKNDLLPGLQKAGVTGYLVGEVVFGGQLPEFWIMRHLPNMAELDAELPLVRALGEEAAAMVLAKAVPLMSKLEMNILEFNEELSWRPETTEGQ
jgi:hypothetical protein